MTRQEHITATAFLAIGRAVTYTSGQLPVPVLGSVLSTSATAANLQAESALEMSLKLLAEIASDDQTVITTAEFRQEIRRIAGSNAVSDAEAKAYTEFHAANTSGVPMKGGN